MSSVDVNMATPPMVLEHPTVLLPSSNVLQPVRVCVGLTRDEYDEYRLEQAPFLHYKFTASNVSIAMDTIRYLIQTRPPMETYNKGSTSSSNLSIPSSFGPLGSFFGVEAKCSDPPVDTTAQVSTSWNASDSKAPLPSIEEVRTNIYDVKGIYAPTKPVYGPIYTFLAKDINTNMVEGYLYFPSMSKTGKPWSSYYNLGIYHRWMYRLIYGNHYYVRRPQYRCKQTLMALSKGSTASSPDYTLEMGCRTEDDFTCVMSKKRHKRQKMYRKGKKKEAYPAAYFRVYKVNVNDPTVADYINPNGFTDLQRNILPSNIDMFVGCRYLLVSPNGQYIFILGRTKVGLLKHLAPKDAIWDRCARNKIPDPKTLIPIWIVPFTGGYDTRLAVEDGKIRIYSRLSQDGQENLALTINASETTAVDPLAIVLTDNGELRVYDRSNKVVSDGNGIFSTNSDNPYDPDADFRQRLLNLIAYLKMVGRYTESGVDVPLDNAVPTVAPIINFQNVEPYNSTEDYLKRLTNLVLSMRLEGRLKEDDPQYNMQPSTSADTVTGASGQTSRFGTFGIDLGIKTNFGSSGGNTDAKATGYASAVDGDDPPNPEDEINDDGQLEKYFTNKDEGEQKASDDAERSLAEAEDNYESGASSNMDVPGTIPNAYDGRFGSNTLSSITGLFSKTSTYDQLATANGMGITCPVPDGAGYDPNADFYCRLVGLRDYIRSQNRKLEEPIAERGADIFRPPTTDVSITAFDWMQDNTTRKQAWYSLYNPM